MDECTSQDTLPILRQSNTGLKTDEGCSSNKLAPGVAGDGPVASAEAPAAAEAGSMALSITCHAPFSNLVGWKCLLSGIDTLYLGIYVEWSKLWPVQVEELEAAKLEAAGTEGLPVNDGRFLVLPGGKPPNYRFHLQFPSFHLYLSHRQEPHRNTPNVYACIGSKSLWLNGVEGAVNLVLHEIEVLAGNVLKIKPSRCDLAADFVIPEDLTLDLLLSHRVPSHLDVQSHIGRGRLETFYQGARKSPIQLRIYDKGLEVTKGGTKLWFLDLWKLETADHVWRIEFQLRRAVLKAFKANSVAELVNNLGSIWRYLTEDWFSLRLPDDPNASRRTVHPGWLSVQMIDRRFGEPRKIDRDYEEFPADVQWYIAHISGCLAGYAARRRIEDVEKATDFVAKDILRYWSSRDFVQQYKVKSIKLGYSGTMAQSTNDVGETSHSDASEGGQP